MSLDPSYSNDTTHDGVDSFDLDNAVNTNDQVTESTVSKSMDEVFTKYQDWDLTETESSASNDVANNGDSRENPKMMPSNDSSNKDTDSSQVVTDTPDSWGLAMSVKRALWPMAMSNTFGNSESFQRAKQVVLLIEKRQEKIKALLSVLNEAKNCYGTVIYVQDDRQANFIAVYLSELKYSSVSVQSDHEVLTQELALEDFKKNKAKILVTTSSASAGKNLSNVRMVINYGLPNTREEYLRRIKFVDNVEIPGRVLSFFDPECDSKFAIHLLCILEEAKQEVPPFLPFYCIYDGTNDKSDSD